MNKLSAVNKQGSHTQNKDKKRYIQTWVQANRLNSRVGEKRMVCRLSGIQILKLKFIRSNLHVIICMKKIIFIL